MPWKSAFEAPNPCHKSTMPFSPTLWNPKNSKSSTIHASSPTEFHTNSTKTEIPSTIPHNAHPNDKCGSSDADSANPKTNNPPTDPASHPKWDSNHNPKIPHPTHAGQNHHKTTINNLQINLKTIFRQQDTTQQPCSPSKHFCSHPYKSR